MPFENTAHKPTSIHRGLLVSLTVVLVSCLLVLVAAAYLYYSLKIKDDVQDQADLYAQSVSKSMERLLWTMDSDAIINVGLYYQSFHDVSAMQVVDSFGETIFSFDKELPETVVKRDVEVVYEGAVVGFVHLAMSTASYKERNLELLVTGLTLALLVGGVLLVFAHFILRYYLKKPLNHLNELALAFSSGDFDNHAPKSPCVEFQGVVSALSKMARTIKTQIAELKKAEAAYRSIFENTVEGLVQTLPDGRINKINPAMVRMLGYDDSGQALGKPLTSTALYADPRRREELLKMLEEHGQIRGVEVELMRRDGEPFMVSIHSQGTFVDGKLSLIDSMVENITERKQAEAALQKVYHELEDRVEQRTRELKDANERLRNLDDLKSALLSAVSHDIRTPLTSVLGFAKLASKDFAKYFEPVVQGDPVKKAKGERIFSALGTIIEEGERLTRLINDYLDLSKIESGRSEWNDRDIDVGELVTRACKALEFVVEETPDLELKLDQREDPLVIHADFDRMLQVMVNLLDNAVKYTRHGEITVSASRKGRDALSIRIADTGLGIPEADLPLVFEKFHQVDRADTLSDTPKGTGLGLAICKQIVEHYGGRITVSSTLGSGSVFTVLLPAAHSA